ncbi:dTDP-4-dehydrorhamnose reductase [Hydrogenispora ethanolica]|jgi:dTDP-4-dehydrorhamnose reductase|uniref:dTDP-4-dehydrorhamnose reductase n=1 Tax=Hydrogenispora ethanolica TaxID=1082276 RepID=A0A4R1R475_HYDET|nr:SDR family oxidoreductase [Hydrogenispora ethanolica]TCL60286.1 dTDP-4-dehydrorhamnose reductase [Hydrogenispora ethanolica]
MRTLITGANGMLGHRMALEFAARFDTLVTQYGEPTYIPGCRDLFIDITKPIIPSFQVDLVVHTAALTDVDYCQKHWEEAWLVNFDGTKNLLKAFPEARFVYISTDFVFDGVSGNYSENALPHPINVYAKSKYAAEQLLPDNSLIVRTCIFGNNLQSNKESLPEKIVKKLQKNQPVSLFSDLFSTPLYTGCLTKLVLQAVERNLTGIWNLAGAQRVSKYEMGLKLAEVYGLNPNLIIPISVNDFQFEAPRPRDVSLNTTKISATFGHPPPTVAESLKCFKEEQESEYQKSIVGRKIGSSGTIVGGFSGNTIRT